MARDMNELLASDETVILETRQHWFVVLRDTAVLILLLIGTSLAIRFADDAGWLDNAAGDGLVIALWVAWCIILVMALWRVLGWFTERFYVTTSKIVYARGILNRNVTSTPLVKIDELTVRRPLLGRMLGFGRLDVENASGGSEPLAGLEYLPQPLKLYQMISERSRNQRMVEGGAHRDDDGDGLVDKSAAPDPAADRGDGRWKPTGDSTAG